MSQASHRYGFGLSSLLHLGLALAALWAWQQRPDDIALPGETVPVTLSMFAEPVPVAVPQEQPVALPEQPPEPVVEPEPEPLAAPEPPAPPIHPEVTPEKRPAPVKQAHEPVEPPAKPAPKSEPKPQPEAPETSPVARPTPAVSASAAAARVAEQATLRARYKARLLEAIERNKFYPKRARRRGVEGAVLLAFTIEPDGRLSDIRVVEGSGARVLDEAALSALQRLSRVDPLPPELDIPRWALTVPMVFEIH